MTLQVPREIYIRVIGKAISTERMNHSIIAYALQYAFNRRFSGIKTEIAKERLYEALSNGCWYAKRPTFAEKLNETKAKTLVSMLSPTQRQALIIALTEE